MVLIYLDVLSSNKRDYYCCYYYHSQRSVESVLTWEKVEECAMETGIADKTEVSHVRVGRFDRRDEKPKVN